MQSQNQLFFNYAIKTSPTVKAFSLPSFEAEVENDSSDDESDDDVLDSDEGRTERDDDTLYGDFSPQHVPCFAHALQLVVRDGLYFKYTSRFVVTFKTVHP